MSLIIKGIDLPKEKVETIEVIFRCEEDGSLYSIRELLEPTEAIQIPKGHGRLIDANKLWEDMLEGMDFAGYQSWVMDVIEFAPTILESEVMPK